MTAPGACAEANLVGGLALLLLNRREEGQRRLRAVNGDVTVALRVLGLVFIALDLASEAGGRAAALVALQQALAMRPDAARARLLRALLLAEVDRPAALDEMARLVAPPGPVFDDPADLALRELPFWLVSIFPEPSPPSSQALAPSAGGREIQAVRAELLRDVAERRWGRAYRDATEAARRALQSANRPLTDALPERVLAEGEAAWALQDFPGVSDVCARFLLAHPGEGQPAVEAMLLRSLNRRGEHDEILARWAARDPRECLDCAVVAAEAHLKVGDGRGRPLLEQVQLLDPRRVDALLLLGKTLLQEGRAAEAVDPLRRAAARSPDDLAVIRTLGQALRQSGQDGAAAPILGRYQQIFEQQERSIRQEELRSNAHASYSEAQDALRRGDLRRVDQLVGSLQSRAADFPLLPLLLAARQAATGERPDAGLLQRALDAGLQANPWLPRPPATP